MKKILAKIIDVKSIITLLLVITLTVVVLNNIIIDERTFNLFSNVVTMVMTYFFTKKAKGVEND